MTGSFSGNILALVFFLFFQICGVIFAAVILKKESLSARILAGSVFGSVLLHWLPTITSLVLGFSIVSHIAAVLLCAVSAVLVTLKFKPNLKDITGQFNLSGFTVSHFIPLAVYGVFALLVTGSFEFRDGVMYSGQATFGDTSMHLGFITSIAEQGVFPPDYSILPGTKLSYPFLSDSISSSLYIFGAGLKFSYCLPMYFAGAQVMYGLWHIMKNWLKDRAKILLAWVLFMLCGGFGFVYFLSGVTEDPSNFTRIFTAFYETPTNLVGENIRWVNVIVDMLLPQRATLFGWAVLMPAIYLLFKAVWNGERGYFIIVAVLAGALPMIHTHSFVSLALVSAGWLLMYMADKTKLSATSAVVKVSFAASLVFMQLLQIIVEERESEIYLVFLLIYILIFAAFFLLLTIRFIARKGTKELLSTWGVYLGITLILALPQLFAWTFRQASGENFIRGYFNWANINDNYLWFYIKNLGVTLLMFVPGLINASHRNTKIVFPVLLIWVISELAVFQPNVYDNNKFLYVAFVFVCGLAADYMTELFHKVKSLPGSKLLAACTVFICVISALLTIGREFNAEYELMGKSQMNAAGYIMEHTEPEDTILTDQRHNNAVAALTGRNIVCGSTSYLFFHGLDYADASLAQEKMYEEPRTNARLFEEYSVDYIMISSYERSSYDVDEAAIMDMFSCVFAEGDVAIYSVK